MNHEPCLALFMHHAVRTVCRTVAYGGRQKSGEAAKRTDINQKVVIDVCHA